MIAVVAVVAVWVVLPATTRADEGTIEVGGRVFARGEAVRFEGEETEAHGEIASARLEGKYEWHWLRAVIEIEFREGADLRDVYVRGANELGRVQAGRFKEPVSAIEMESGWTLPMASRGQLREVLTDQLGIAGRHPGLMGTWHGAPLDLRVSLGVFQGEDIDGQELADAVRSAARVSIEVAKTEIGAYFEHRDSNPGGRIERLWAAGLDATVKVAGLRTWIDGMVGSSWEDAVVDADLANFAMVRLIAAFRFLGDEVGDLYLEPFFSGGVLDPDLDVRADLLTELAFGLNVGAWKRARLQLEVERNDGRKNTPEQLEPRPLPSGEFEDRLAFLVQVGAAF